MFLLDANNVELALVFARARRSPFGFGSPRSGPSKLQQRRRACLPAKRATNSRRKPMNLIMQVNNVANMLALHRAGSSDSRAQPAAVGETKLDPALTRFIRPAFAY
jgi:hypothetical protein